MFDFLLRRKLLWIGLLINILLYISAYQTGWFDYLFSGGALHLCQGCQGMDFYQIPNGFYAYIHGGKLTGESAVDGTHYWNGRYVNANVYHPFFTIILGAFLTLFPSQSSFYVWMALKWVITLAMLIYLYRNFGAHKYIDLAAFVLLTFMAQYHEIRISQFHFVLNALFLLLFIQFTKKQDGWLHGLYYFLSLLVKPIGLLWLPALFVKKRYKMLALGIGWFAIATMTFLLSGVGAYYIKNIGDRLVHPVAEGPTQVMSLDALLRYSTPVPDFVLLLLKGGFLLLILYLSLFRKVHLFKVIFLSIVFYVLFFDLIYEYYYTTFIPIVVIALLTLPEFQTRAARAAIVALCLPSAFFLLRLFHFAMVDDPFFGPNPTLLGWQLMTLSKLLPVLVLTVIVIKADIISVFQQTRIRWQAMRKSITVLTGRCG